MPDFDTPDTPDATGQRARAHTALGNIAASPFLKLPLTLIVARSAQHRGDSRPRESHRAGPRVPPVAFAFSPFSSRLVSFPIVQHRSSGSRGAIPSHRHTHTHTLSLSFSSTPSRVLG